jgi:hypothetical protein
MDTMGVGEDLPPPIRESRRVRVLNKLNLGLAPSPTPPGTPTPDQTFQVFSPTLPRQPVPSAKTPPALVTLERAAACALFFEQYYHALAHRCSRAAPPLGGGRQHRGRASAKTFEFGRVIGQGAFGVVRIAREKENGRMVAIKQLRKVE